MTKTKISPNSRKKDVKPKTSLKDMEIRLKKLESEVKNAKAQMPTDDMTIVVLDGEMDKLMAAFILANTAKSMGINVTMFFTFWGITAIKKSRVFHGKTLPEKMLTLMLPPHAGKTNLSHFNMFGLGRKFLEFMMKQKHIDPLTSHINMAQELGVRMISCRMTMDLMGIKPDELLDTVEFGGAATCIGNAVKSKINFFI